MIGQTMVTIQCKYSPIEKKTSTLNLPFWIQWDHYYNIMRRSLVGCHSLLQMMPQDRTLYTSLSRNVSPFGLAAQFAFGSGSEMYLFLVQ